MVKKIDSLINDLNREPAQASRATQAQGAKDQFLQMLIAQLKNQDPLNPVSNDRFAVDLAVFSQLEQLISLNEKMSSLGDGLGLSANLLGKTAILKDPLFNILENRLEESIFVNIPEDYEKLMLEFRDEAGQTVFQKTITDFRKGRNLISIEDIQLPDGSYQVFVYGVKNGMTTELDPRPAMTIHGFIPGNTPKFIAGSREIILNEIAEFWQL
ncbi:MAG: hypothetical protein NZT61_06395 [Deltaproteobacteria bacterium]|nr:hypothetical protein [Deltaproteobacteria bacterium]